MHEKVPGFRSKCVSLARSPAAGRAVEDCLILQYRRVALLSHDPLRLAVQPCNFERQMEYLATSFHFISLSKLKWHLESATPFSSNTVAITFDGGYSDVLYTAKEVLARFEIPATVFVPSLNLVERGRFWWDRLEDLIIAGSGRQALTIDIGGEMHRWPLTTDHDRYRAFDDLYTILSDKTPCQQRDIVAQVMHSLRDRSEACDGHATLSAEELRQLDEGDCITIGGQTHSCVKLSCLPECEQVCEIGRNKQALEEVLGHTVEYFAYPFGDQGRPMDMTKRILEGFGFTLACHASADTVSTTAATDPYELPRLTIRDWNPFTFHRCLKAYLG